MNYHELSGFNSRILIIDDQIKEALPIINAYSKRGSSSFYFDGQKKNLPHESLEGIRIVFQDLHLIESGGHADDKTKAAAAVAILDAIIAESNGPYIVILWTKHKEIIKHFKTYAKDLTCEPLKILDRDKYEFLEFKQIDNNQTEVIADFKKIQEMIESIYLNYEVFKIFYFWESIIQESVNKTITEFSKIFSIDENFNKKLMNLFYSLAKAEMGKTIVKREEEILERALVIFNTISIDTIEHLIIEKSKKTDLKILADSTAASCTELNAKINSKLNISNDTIKLYPGNIYDEFEVSEKCKERINSNMKNSKCFEENKPNIPILDFLYEKNTSVMFDIYDPERIGEDFANNKQIDKSEIKKENGGIKKDYKKEFEKHRKKLLKEIGKNFLRIHIDISAYCDFAQGKQKNQRILRGYLIPEKYIEFIRRADYLYQTFIFEYEDKNYFIIFDYRYFFSISAEILQETKPIFRFRKSFVNELQAKITHHINRPALIFLTPE